MEDIKFKELRKTHKGITKLSYEVIQILEDDPNGSPLYALMYAIEKGENTQERIYNYFKYFYVNEFAYIRLKQTELDDLLLKGIHKELIQKENNTYSLTEKGNEVLAKSKKVNLVTNKAIAFFFSEKVVLIFSLVCLIFMSSLKIIVGLNSGSDAFICFPELCFNESFKNEVKPYEQMIIIGGSYYDDNNFNVCPIFIRGNQYIIQKINPASPNESEIFEGEGMKCGKDITIFQTDDKKFRFIVLICKDFLNEGIKFITGKKKVDFIFVPSYNRAKNKFQQLADTFCNIYKVDSGISNISEKLIANKSYFGGSSFFCFEHKDVINVIKSKYKMRDDPREFKILEAKGESMLIMDLFLKKVELSKAPESTPRIKIIGIYRYNQNIWIKQ